VRASALFWSRHVSHARLCLARIFKRKTLKYKALVSILRRAGSLAGRTSPSRGEDRGFKSHPAHLRSTRPIFSIGRMCRVQGGLFSFSEDFVASVVANEVEASFYQLARFLFRVGYFGRVIVVFEVDQMRVDEGVVDVSVTEELHDVKNVLGLVVFHCGFPVSEGVEFDLEEPWVLQLGGGAFALYLVCLSHCRRVWVEQSWHILWQGLDHAHEPDGYLEYSEVAAFSGVILPHSGRCSSYSLISASQIGYVSSS
jgi:hypothetical protein